MNFPNPFNSPAIQDLVTSTFLIMVVLEVITEDFPKEPHPERGFLECVATPRKPILQHQPQVVYVLSNQSNKPLHSNIALPKTATTQPQDATPIEISSANGRIVLNGDTEEFDNLKLWISISNPHPQSKAYTLKIKSSISPTLNQQRILEKQNNYACIIDF